MSLDFFHYIYKNNGAPKALFLFHGTGGSEQDFFFLNEELQAHYNLVGVSGNVQESGMNRFFKRLSEGVFDIDNMKEEAAKLQSFLVAWQKKYRLSYQDCAALGFSNGANMVLGLMLFHTEPLLFEKVVLLHPMLPFSVEPKPGALTGVEVLVTHGEHDAMVPVEQQEAVNEVIVALGAELNVKKYQSGHQVSKDEMEDVQTWLRAISR